MKIICSGATETVKRSLTIPSYYTLSVYTSLRK